MNEFIANLEYVHRVANVELPAAGEAFATAATQLSNAGATSSEQLFGAAQPQWMRLTAILQDAMVECSKYLYSTAKNLNAAGREFDATDGDNANDLTWVLHEADWPRATKRGEDPDIAPSGLTGPGY